MTVLVGADGSVRATIPGTVRQRHSVDQLLDAWGKVESANAKAPAALAKLKDLESVSQQSWRQQSWRQLRGARQGHAPNDSNLATDWTEKKNVAWKTEIAGSGWSSPVIDNDQVWLTTAIESKRSLRAICINAKDGKIRLDVEIFNPKALLEKHGRNGHATPTPVLDDRHVYLHFGSYGTAAIDRQDGTIIWKNQETVINHQWGPGSSPVLHEDLLIFNCDGMDVRYVTALDKNTGKRAWKTDRSIDIKKDGFFRKAFSTPLVASVNGKEMILTAGANQFSALAPSDGSEFWSNEYFGYAGVTVPVSANGIVFSTSGFGDGKIFAIQLDDTKDRKSGELIWSTKRNVPIIPTPIVIDSELYMVNDKGILSCLDAATGQLHWQHRLTGNHAASLVYGDGKLYVSNDKGETRVIEPSTKACKILATNKLDSNIQATPAISDHSLFIRTKKSLYRIQSNAE